jgi:acetoin utilization protein AcuC
VPETWLSGGAAMSPVALPRLMRDDPADYPVAERATEIADRNRRTTERVLEKVMPLIR